MDWLRYSNQNAVRNDPLSPELVKTLSFLPELGLTAEVISGGQENNTTQGTGSTRHTRGNAGDLRFYQGDRLLDFTNLADQKLGAEIVRRSRAGGATGMGWGVDYMGPHTMHIGYGAPAVWGAGGKSANVSPWFRDAYYGAEQTAAPTMMAQNTKGPRMATKPDMTAGGGNQTLLGGSERKGFAGLSPEAWMAISGAFMNMSQPGAGDPQMSAAYGMLGDRRTQAKADEKRNKTIAWLRGQAEKGDEKAAHLLGMYEAGFIDEGVVASQIFQKPEKPDYVTIDGQLVQRNAVGGPAVVPVEGFKEKGPEWREATSDEAQRGILQVNTKTGAFKMAPKGMKIVSDGRGGFTLSQGVGLPADGEMSVGDVYNPAEVQSTLDLIADIKADRQLPIVTGPLQGGGGNDVEQFGIKRRAYYGGRGLAVIQKINQLQSRSWLAARAMLKGGGPITDYESRKAEAAVARLSRAQDDEEFVKALTELEDAIKAGRAKLEAARGGTAGEATNPPADGQGSRYEFENERQRQLFEKFSAPSE